MEKLKPKGVPMKLLWIALTFLSLNAFAEGNECGNVAAKWCQCHDRGSVGDFHLWFHVITAQGSETTVWLMRDLKTMAECETARINHPACKQTM